MSRPEDLQPNAAVRGVLPDCLVTVVGVQWFGSEALELTYKDPAGRVANTLLYRQDEPRIEVVDTHDVLALDLVHREEPIPAFCIQDSGGSSTWESSTAWPRRFPRPRTPASAA